MLSLTIFIAAGMLLLHGNIANGSPAAQSAKYNGPVYVVNITEYKMDDATATATETTMETATDGINFEEIMNMCNQSFVTPMDYLVEFNNTGELPNTSDKTYMCYVRCFYEKTGMLENWQLNRDKIQKYMWPATGDTIDVCQEEGKNESNACVHAYAIAKCLMIRAIVDARSKPTN